MDIYIWNKLWKEIQRRHPRRGLRWCKTKYMSRIGKRNWVVTDELAGKKYRLYKCTDTKIKRHVKLQTGANPYDTKYDKYFETRKLRLKPKNVIT